MREESRKLSGFIGRNVRTQSRKKTGATRTIGLYVTIHKTGPTSRRGKVPTIVAA
jgi:hypothetical protein